jgi:hypothetical protein
MEKLSGVQPRQRLLDQIQDAWSEFQQSYAGLTDPEMLLPGVQGQWSVRDILAHVTTWEEEALRHIPLIMEGGRPPRYSSKYGGIDAFNALMTEQKRGLTLPEVRQQLEAVHQRLIEFVEGVPEHLLAGDSRVRRRIRLDAYGHYPKHARAIRAWRSTAM